MPRYRDITDSSALKAVEVSDRERKGYVKEILNDPNFYRRRTSFVQYVKLKRAEKMFNQEREIKHKEFTKWQPDLREFDRTPKEDFPKYIRTVLFKWIAQRKKISDVICTTPRPQTARPGRKLTNSNMNRIFVKSR